MMIMFTRWLLLMFCCYRCLSSSLTCMKIKTDGGRICEENTTNKLVSSIQCDRFSLNYTISPGEGFQSGQFDSAYIVDFVCTTSISNLPPSENRLLWNGHRTSKLTINATEDVSCRLESCVFDSYGYCWTFLHTTPECSIKVDGEDVSSSYMAVDKVTSTVQELMTPSWSVHQEVSWSHHHYSISHQGLMHSVYTSTSEAVHQEVSWSHHHYSISDQGLIHSAGLSQSSYSPTDASTTEKQSPLLNSISNSSTGSIDLKLSSLFPLMIAILVIFLIVLSVPFSCILLIRLRQKKFKHVSSEFGPRAVIISDIDTNAKSLQIDHISITESVVTIADSLVFNLPGTNHVVLPESLTVTMDNESVISGDCVKHCDKVTQPITFEEKTTDSTRAQPSKTDSSNSQNNGYISDFSLSTSEKHTENETISTSTCEYILASTILSNDKQTEKFNCTVPKGVSTLDKLSKVDSEKPQYDDYVSERVLASPVPAVGMNTINKTFEADVNYDCYSLDTMYEEIGGNDYTGVFRKKMDANIPVVEFSSGYCSTLSALTPDNYNNASSSDYLENTRYNNHNDVCTMYYDDEIYEVL